MRKKDRERYSKIIEQDNRAVRRIERLAEKAERTKANKDLKRFEKIADRHLDLFERDTKRDYW